MPNPYPDFDPADTYIVRLRALGVVTAEERKGAKVPVQHSGIALAWWTVVTFLGLGGLVIALFVPAPFLPFGSGLVVGLGLAGVAKTTW
jgi:hypothetical protein